ncbi:MAG TPA: FAD-dependent oxidoreductase [Pirellulales bacterium]
MPELLILGAGAVGLSLAYEMAGQGWKVRVIDRGQPGRETSWAAAGILPASKFRMRAAGLEWLEGFSFQLHAEWAARLREETGIDNGYRRSGAIYLAETKEVSAELLQNCERWRREGLTVKWTHAADLDRMEPALAGAYDRFPLQGAAHLAEEVQVRSPRHMQALLAACHKRGVEISAGIEACDFQIEGQRVAAVQTNLGPIAVDRMVVTAGAWSQNLAARLGLKITVKPMRGQIVLLNGPPLLTHIINASGHYLLPRDDGRTLVGTTMEDVGFDRRNTAEAVADMLSFATKLAPALRSATVEKAWCGFRPASIDGLPYLGAAPGLENAFIATGHFRQGLWHSTGTAVLMSRLIRGEAPGIDLTPFRVERG